MRFEHLSTATQNASALAVRASAVEVTPIWEYHPPHPSKEIDTPVNESLYIYLESTEPPSRISVVHNSFSSKSGAYSVCRLRAWNTAFSDLSSLSQISVFPDFS